MRIISRYNINSTQKNSKHNKINSTPLESILLPPKVEPIGSTLIRIDYVLLIITKALFASLEGKGGEGFGKKEGASGRNRVHWERRALVG